MGPVKTTSRKNGVSHDVDIQLQLFCEEDELSPAQIRSYNDQMKEHRETKERVQKLKDEQNEIIYIPAGAPIPPPPQIPRTPITNGGSRSF